MIFPFLFHIVTAFRNLRRKSILNYLNALGAVLLILLTACDEIPDGVVEQQTVNFKVTEITAPSNVVYSVSDSMVVTSVQIIKTETISRVWCSVKSLDGVIVVAGQIDLFDDGNVSKNGDQQKGDGIYNSKFGMGKKNPNGKYQIEYFVENNVHQAPDDITKVGTHIFSFDNGQNNLPPVISNLIISDTAKRGETEKFIFSVKADDPNGLADILEVYFKLFRPDGSQVTPPGQNYILMVDNGDLENFGDEKAGDGIYSYKSYYTLTAQTGVWRYEFQAKDRGGKVSNIITHNMTVN